MNLCSCAGRADGSKHFVGGIPEALNGFDFRLVS